jgi:hypothetical protein
MKKPVYQPDTDSCFTAAVAYILELPFEAVPNRPREYPDGQFWKEFDEWLIPRNLKLETQKLCPCDDCQKFAPPGYAILHVEVKSEPSDGHALVYLDGELIHNPGEGGRTDWWGRRMYWYTFRVLDPAQALRETRNQKRETAS